MSELDLYKRQGFAQNVGIIQDAIDRSVDVLAFTRKAPELLKRTETSPLSQIVNQVRPTPDEPVICKRQASAFFGLRRRPDDRLGRGQAVRHGPEICGPDDPNRGHGRQRCPPSGLTRDHHGHKEH